jgi:hypothetical protein
MIKDQVNSFDESNKKKCLLKNKFEYTKRVVVDIGIEI